jgi:hypothetical protein
MTDERAKAAEARCEAAEAQCAAMRGLVQQSIDVLGSGLLSGWVVWDDVEGCQFCTARAPRDASNLNHDADCPVPLGRMYVKRAKDALATDAGADLLAQMAAMRAVLQGYEAWEAAMVLDTRCWGGGRSPWPMIGHEHYDEMMRLQGERNHALSTDAGAALLERLRKAEGDLQWAEAGAASWRDAATVLAAALESPGSGDPETQAFVEDALDCVDTPLSTQERGDALLAVVSAARTWAKAWENARAFGATLKDSASRRMSDHDDLACLQGVVRERVSELQAAIAALDGEATE